MQLGLMLNRSRALAVAAIVTSLLALAATSAPRAQADIANPHLSAGIYGTCAIFPNTRLYCWGSNGSSQLGQGSGARIAYGWTPYPVKGIKAQPVGLSASSSDACAMLITGAISCWGKNSAGALGPANLGGFARSAQSVASLISPWVAPSNESTGAQHLCFRDNNSTVKCQGINNFGQLGNGTNTNSSTPTQVAVITGASAGTKATQVVSGANHSCALLENQNVKCWGVNNYRQLGTPTNTVASVNSPVDVPSLSNNIIQIASKADHSCAIHESGAVSCWGADAFGQLGDGTVAPFKGAVTVDLGTDARQVSTGVSHSCALIKGGGVKCWGSNEFGQLGNGTTTTSAKPVSVIGLARPATEISAGGFHTCARLDNQQIFCWGRGSKGQLGNGDNESSPTAVAVKPFGGIHYASVRLQKGGGHTNFLGTFVAVPPASGTISKICRTNAHLQVGITQDGVTRTAHEVVRLRPSGSSKCSAHFKIRSISNSVSPATLSLRGSYHGTDRLPGASYTQVYANQ